MGPTDHPIEPKTVDVLLDGLDCAIEPVRRAVVSATLSGWKTTNRKWGHADLCAIASTGTGISSRLPMTVPPDVVLAAKRQLGDALVDGAEVTVCGRIEIGDRWNPLRIVAERIEVIEAESAFAQRKRLLIEQLEVSGARTRNRERPLPVLLRRVGLVTPAGGEAGRADFLHRLSQSPAPVAVLERRVPMSGPKAAAAVASAVTALSGTVDAIFVCRGGGARADLVAFDAGEVATAIVRCATPVIVAVGHTTDSTVADEVAHTSLPTPTAAADWIVNRATAAAAQQRDETLRTRVEVERATADTAIRRAECDRAQAARARRHARLAIGVAAALAVILVVTLLLFAR